MIDLCCFSFISALQILQIEKYPRANAGAQVLDIFGTVTPDGSITAILASCLGLKVGLVSNNVGDDAAGQQVTGLLEHFKISSTVTSQHDVSTPVTIVLCDQERNRTWFSFLPEVLEHLLSTDLEMLTLSRFVYVDLYEIIRKAGVRAVQRASQCAVPLFINLGGDHLQEQDVILLRNANVAVLQTSLDESSQRRPEDYAKELQDLIQPEMTVVTLAQKGLVCVTASAIMYVPAYFVHTIHSNGAGAAFSAGFAYAYLQRWDVEKSLHFASALGGLFCTVKDGFGRFTPEYVLDFIEKQEHR